MHLGRQTLQAAPGRPQLVRGQGKGRSLSAHCCLSQELKKPCPARGRRTQCPWTPKCCMNMF